MSFLEKKLKKATRSRLRRCRKLKPAAKYYLVIIWRSYESPPGAAEPAADLYVSGSPVIHKTVHQVFGNPKALNMHGYVYKKRLPI